MSSFHSAFHSSSTLFTIDFYKQYKPKAPEKELVLGGTMATVLRWCFVSLGWIPFMKSLMWRRDISFISKYPKPTSRHPWQAVFLFGYSSMDQMQREHCFLWHGFCNRCNLAWLSSYE